ncbi:MAG: type II toxin-antitoxin system RelE/ParE family toxin [Planctomycetota bacterium]|nr:type II toxin-antitoxin system RelE/ParE family toxin [Planctomycetota bacterium]
MAWSVRFTDEARKNLHGLHIDVQRKIKRAVKQLANGTGADKPLIGRLQGFFSCRVGKYRVIYTLNRDVMTVHVVGHRREVYGFVPDEQSST